MRIKVFLLSPTTHYIKNGDWKQIRPTFVLLLARITNNEKVSELASISLSGIK